MLSHSQTYKSTRLAYCWGVPPQICRHLFQVSGQRLIKTCKWMNCAEIISMCVCFRPFYIKVASTTLLLCNATLLLQCRIYIIVLWSEPSLTATYRFVDTWKFHAKPATHKDLTSFNWLSDQLIRSKFENATFVKPISVNTKLIRN